MCMCVFFGRRASSLRRTVDSIAGTSTQQSAKARESLLGANDTIHRLQRQLRDAVESHRAEVASLTARLHDAERSLVAAASDTARTLQAERVEHQAARTKELATLGDLHEEHLARVAAQHERQLEAAQTAVHQARDAAARQAEASRQEVAALKVAHLWQLRAREKAVRDTMGRQLAEVTSRLAAAEASLASTSASCADEVDAARRLAQAEHERGMQELMAQHQQCVSTWPRYRATALPLVLGAHAVCCSCSTCACTGNSMS